MRAVNIQGQRFKMLSVLAMAPNKGKKTAWLIRCDCGTEKVMTTSDIKNPAVKSCGCHKNNIVIKRNKDTAKHGLTGTPTYITWMNMIDRCDYAKDVGYKNYGGRGIKVCKEWYDFRRFYADMGERPKGKTIDRIDVDKGYFKENCRWATPLEQAANKRKKKCA